MRNIALSAVVCQVAGDPVVAREASTGTRPLLSRAPLRSLARSLLTSPPLPAVRVAHITVQV